MSDHSTKVIDCSSVWRIEEFSQKGAACLVSPVLNLRVLTNNEWNLKLYPNGVSDDYRNYLSIYLHRNEVSHWSKTVRIEFTISILAIDVSSNVSKKITSMFFPKNSNFGFSKFLSRDYLLANRNTYLPKDVLSVQIYIVRKDNAEDLVVAGAEQTLLQNDYNVTALNNDLLRLYLDTKVCDVQIQTDDRNFSVHKTVLCARSPVFLAMFQSDTREKKKGYVDITDLDSETVSRMLTFMYSDHVEDLDQDQAAKLYAAADKYEILPLRQKCSSILKFGLSDGNVCDVCILADMHQDIDLKAAVLEYLYIYSTRVFKSREWENFMQLNPKLSAEIMHKLWIKHLDD